MRKRDKSRLGAWRRVLSLFELAPKAVCETVCEPNLSADRRARSGGRRSRRILVALPWILLCGGIVAVQWSLHGWLYAASDDPYIYLGYVKRALSEPPALFSYNPGEHSAGTTGLLYYYLLLVVCGVLHAVLFFLPLPQVLLLGLWLLNTTLFLLAGAWYLKAASRLGIRAAGGPPAIDAALFLLFCANPKFLWGAFSGLENPLSALLVLLLFERLLARAPAWQAALAAAALAATRPETLSVLWAAPLGAALAAAPPARRRTAPLANAFATALATFGAAVVLLFLPCRLATAQWLPSSSGARVQLIGLADPTAFVRTLGRAFGDGGYWSSEWLLYTYASIALSAFVIRRCRVDLLAMALAVLVFYVVRAGLGLQHFDIEDRYVSYLWPLHALVFAAAGAAVAPRLSAGALRRAGAPVVAVLLCVLSLFPIADFFVRFERHVDLMHQVVVQPSRWMQANLPAHSRICMEPAGAIRVFTDFYLVDVMGLTTTHRRGYRGSYPQFLLKNRIDYVFDRDDRAALLVRRGRGRRLLTWGRGVKFGDKHLYEVGPPRNAAIVRLAASSTLGPASAKAAFDNAATAATGTGEAWIASSAPAWIEAALAMPVPVDRIEIVVRLAPDDSPDALRVEGIHGGARIPFDAVSARPLAGGLQALSFALPAPRELDGIRIEVSDPAPLEIVEVTAARRDTRHWWLDLR